MNRTEFLQMVASARITINGDECSLSSAVVAVGHAGDVGTLPRGVTVDVPRDVLAAWEGLDDAVRDELWDAGCRGTLDHAAEPDPHNVVPIRR